MPAHCLVCSVTKECGDIVLHAKRPTRIPQPVLSIQSLYPECFCGLQKKSSLMPAHCLVCSVTKECGDKHPVCVFCVMFSAAKIDFCYLAFVFLRHSFKLQICSDLHGDLHGGPAHVQGPHSPWPENQALCVS